MPRKDPDIEAFTKLVKQRAAARGEMTIPQRRAQFETDMGTVPIADGCTIESLDLSGVPAERITHPAAVPGKTLLYLHGGGHVMGSLKTHRHFVSRLAVAARATAFHIDYRLAPEHPYPAALDDAMKAYRRILADGIAPQNLVVGGESAGGNLAAALLLKAREEGLRHPGGLYLLSPWLDMTTTGESYDKVGERDIIITREGIELVAAAYLGGAADNAFTSPVRADVAGLPPTLIQVGSDELLLSDSLVFASRAAMAAVEVKLHVWPEMPHAWPLFHPFIRAGLAATAEAGRWMQHQLALGPAIPS
jgi:monoterpene epsilon-lactone hydrolase